MSRKLGGQIGEEIKECVQTWRTPETEIIWEQISIIKENVPVREYENKIFERMA